MRCPTRIILTLLFLLMGIPSLTQAAPPQSVYLEDLTWLELRQRIEQGSTTVLVPVGATEQNGPQMTLGKHTQRIRYLSGAIAQQLGNTLVAPILPIAPEGTIEPPSGHLKFPGTLTLSDAAFQSTLTSVAESLKKAGFRRIVLLADHGGNQKSLLRVANDLNRKWGSTGTRVLALTDYYRASQTDFAQWLRARGYSMEVIGEHAGLADTSLMMAIDPLAVRTPADRTGLRSDENDGVRGNPKGSSAELGQWAVHHIIEVSVNAIRAFQAPLR